jgi:S-DNA-T family DNA segregation ATPase FtsK/SpoIIIE
MDMLETSGYITSANGSKAREVLITLADLESIQDASANN